MSRKIAYVSSERLIHECDRLPVIEGRASLVNSLIQSYKIIQNFVNCDKRIACEEELKLFHTSEYLKFLKENNERDSDDDVNETDLEYGLGYDCEPLDKLWDFVQIIAGGTLKAVECIMYENFDIAINWNGGWHHAQRDAASGFCYVNDIVIGIQKMKEKFKRILYIDLDVHHGDGVENAFSTTKRVFTLSFHQYEAGFFPGTGSINECGFGSSRGYAANFPYRENLSGALLSKYFKLITRLILDKYEPDSCVIQCGADILAGDTLGNNNLIPNNMNDIINEILHWKLPTIFLGGGGYNKANTARFWTHLTALIHSTKISNEIPDHEYYLHYSPDFELNFDARNISDPNTEEEFEQKYNIIKSNLNQYFITNNRE